MVLAARTHTLHVVWVCVSIYVCENACVCVCVCAFIWVCVCICMCACVCACVNLGSLCNMIKFDIIQIETPRPESDLENMLIPTTNKMYKKVDTHSHAVSIRPCMQALSSCPSTHSIRW